MNELNPNNPITQQMHDNWHKVVALLMADYGINEFEITAQMLEDFGLVGGAVVADARNGRFVIRLVSNEEAERLARKEGVALPGLPNEAERASATTLSSQGAIRGSWGSGMRKNNADE